MTRRLAQPATLPPAVRAGESGFTLVEGIVALVLVMLAAVMGMALLAQHPRAQARLDKHAEALRLIEYQLEAIRAGNGAPMTEEDTLVARPGDRGMNFGLSGNAGGQGEVPYESPIDIVTTFRGTDVSGLYEVTVTATYLLEKKRRQRSVRTMVWRP